MSAFAPAQVDMNPDTFRNCIQPEVRIFPSKCLWATFEKKREIVYFYHLFLQTNKDGLQINS